MFYKSPLEGKTTKSLVRDFDRLDYHCNESATRLRRVLLAKRRQHDGVEGWSKESVRRVAGSTPTRDGYTEERGGEKTEEAAGLE